MESSGKNLSLNIFRQALNHDNKNSQLQFVDDNLCVMSVGFLLDSPRAAVIWRGPRKNGSNSSISIINNNNSTSISIINFYIHFSRYHQAVLYGS